MMTPRFLHVANGSCTTDLIAEAGIAGLRSIWADPLYEGPVPSSLTDDELRDVRAQFLANPDAEVDEANDLRRWRRVIEDISAYDELVLWYEHDLFDQLNLVQILSWLPRDVRRKKIVSLVSIASFPGHPEFKGLGELSPGEITSLVERRQPVGTPEYATAAVVWDAFRQPAPERLAAVRRSDVGALPYVSAAIDRFLQEYPWTIDGLSRSERRLLRLAEGAPIDLGSAFPLMHEGERFYYITDGSLREMATTLSTTRPPLIALDDGGRGRSLLRGIVALTDAGREALAGNRDRVSCGLDRWLGGVHLHDGGADWRWDDERHDIVKR